MNVSLSHVTANVYGSDNDVTVYRWLGDDNTQVVSNSSTYNGVNDNMALRSLKMTIMFW